MTKEKYTLSNIKGHLHDFYLDYFNNFISAEGVAKHYGLSTEDANTLMRIGKKVHEQMFAKG